MNEKRFIDDGIEDIENQSFIDNLTGKIYYIDNGFDDIVDLVSRLYDEKVKFENLLDEKRKNIRDLKDTLAYRSEQLSFVEHLIDDLGCEEMRRQWKEFNCLK